MILLTGPLLIPLCILYWKSRRIIVRGDVEHSIPVRGRAAAAIVRDLQQVLSSRQISVAPGWTSARMSSQSSPPQWYAR